MRTEIDVPAARPHNAPPDTRRISVVIPVYNGAAYLAATLRSVLDQTCAPGEVIVVDDGSVDETAAIARSFDVTVISQENRGLSAARNAGTHAATGEYIAYLDGDDLWAPDKLEVQFGALCAYGHSAFSFTDYRIFDESGVDERYGVPTHPAFRKTIGRIGNRRDVVIEPRANQPVLPDDYILPSSTLIRRADILAVGGFDETLRISEDHEFFLRLFRIVPALVVIRPLVLYRRHAAQISAKPIALVEAFFEIARRLADSPERYRRADVRYFARGAFRAHRRIAILHARLGNFDEAGAAFGRSLAACPTLGAVLGLIASRVGRSPAGRSAFIAARWILRRLRSGKRAAAPAPALSRP